MYKPFLEYRAGLLKTGNEDKDTHNTLAGVISIQGERMKKLSAASEDILKTINKKIIYGKSHEEILDYAFESLSAFIPYDRIGIGLREGDVLRHFWVRSNMPTEYLKKDYTANIKNSSLEKILLQGEARIISDLEQYYQENPKSKSTDLALKDGIRSSLTYPLIYKGQHLGIIFFSSACVNTYKKVHVDIFREFADSISLAVGYHSMKAHAENFQKDKMLSTVIHDLREPLGVIVGFLGLAMEEDWYKSLDEEQKQFLKIVERNSQTMLNLVNELNKAREQDVRQLMLQPKDVYLMGFLDEICQDAVMMTTRKNILFNTNVDLELPIYAKFDPHRIRQVLSNLLSNAVKFSHSETKITLSVVKESSKLFFSISDEGLGIPENEIPTLFTEYGKTSKRPTNGESSTGLGLSICKQIVEGHGGRIFVNSKAGSGSVFKFFIPMEAGDGV